MDFWVWVIILLVAWALEALATAAKKKREGPPSTPSRTQRVPPPQPPQRRPVARRPAPVIVHPPDVSRQPSRQHAPDPASDTEEAFRIEVPVKRAPRPRVFETGEPLEGVSAEVLAPEVGAQSTAAQHLRALEKYGRAAPGARRRTRRLPRQLMKLREAIIWMEILGPPKGGR